MWCGVVGERGWGWRGVDGAGGVWMGLEGCGWKRGVGGGVSEKELGVSEREAHHTVVESWSEDINPHDLRVAVI